MIHVYYSDTSPLHDDDLFKSLYDRVSPERKAKADRLYFRKDRNLSLGAAALLSAGLREYGLTESEMVYDTGSSGKPFFLNAPDIHFSLSHSDDKVMVCFSGAELGCDIEKVKDTDFKIAQRFFCRSEYDAIMENAEYGRRRETFFRLWTLKESFVKATGKGMSLAANAFEIDLSGDRVRVRDDTDMEICNFAEFDLFPGYKSALCVFGDIGDIELKFVDMLACIG